MARFKYGEDPEYDSPEAEAATKAVVKYSIDNEAFRRYWTQLAYESMDAHDLISPECTDGRECVTLFIADCMQRSFVDVQTSGAIDAEVADVDADLVDWGLVASTFVTVVFLTPEEREAEVDRARTAIEWDVRRN